MGNLSYTPPPDPLLGQVLAGRYMIQQKLGEGGMGAVYLATHRVLEKDVALKVLHGEFARKPDLVERFMQEAKAASRIRHENVIDISDFGTTPDGLVFFAMELLKGHDLHEEIARARLSGTRLQWSRTRPIFLQICGALTAAHAMGVVHRDLKPENIYLVEWLGHRDFVKLLDFGIAKLTEVSEGDRKLTRTGMLFGTPEYMSPEQAKGEQVDHRVDVYAMGCILYQLVTGRVPFEAENFMGILSMHLTETPAPIAPAIFGEIGAPPALERVIAKALVKDRNLRFQTIEQLANAIRALDNQGEVSASYPSLAAARRTRQWTGQVSLPTEDDVEAPKKRGGSRVPIIALAAIVALGVGGLAFVLAGGGGKKSGTKPTPPVEEPNAAVTDAGAPNIGPPAGNPRVTLTFESTPPGADVFDVAAQKSLGPTPLTLEVEKSSAARSYRLSLDGYVTKTIDVAPLQDAPVATTLELVKKGGNGKQPTKTPVKEPLKEPQKEPVIKEIKEPVKEPDKVPDPDEGDDEPVIKNPFPAGGGSGSAG